MRICCRQWGSSCPNPIPSWTRFSSHRTTLDATTPNLYWNCPNVSGTFRVSWLNTITWTRLTRRCMLMNYSRKMYLLQLCKRNDPSSKISVTLLRLVTFISTSNPSTSGTPSQKWNSNTTNSNSSTSPPSCLTWPKPSKNKPNINKPNTSTPKPTNNHLSLSTAKPDPHQSPNPVISISDNTVTLLEKSLALPPPANPSIHKSSSSPTSSPVTYSASTKSNSTSTT